MALKVGDLYVALSANVDGFTKSLNSVTKDIARVAKQVDAFGQKVAQLGVAASAAFGAALLASAQWSSETQAQLDRVKATALTFSAEIGDALLPFLKSVGDSLQTLLGMWQALDPKLKNAVATTIAYTASVGLAIGAVGKFAGIVGAMADMFGSVGIPAIKGMSKGLVSFAEVAGKGLPSIGSMVSGIGGAFSGLGSTIAAAGSAILTVGAPILAVVAAVAALVALGGVLYHVYKDNSVAINAAFASAWKTVKSFLGFIWDSFKATFTAAAEFFKSIITIILDGFALVVRGFADQALFMANALGLDSLAKKLEPLTKLDGKTLADGLFSGLKSASDWAIDAGKGIGEGIVFGAKYAVQGLGMAVSDIKGAVFGGSKPKGKVRKAALTADSFEVGSPDMSNDLGDSVLKAYQNIGPVTALGQALSDMHAKELEDTKAAVEAHFQDLQSLQDQIDPARRLGEQLGLAKELYDQGRISQSQYYTELVGYLDQTSDSFRMLHDSAQTITDGLTNGFLNMANGVKGAFSSMVASIAADLERLALKKGFQMLLNLGLSALGGAFSGGSAGDNLISGLQDQGTIGTGVGTGVEGFGALRSSAGASVSAPMNFSIVVNQDGSVSSDSHSNSANAKDLAAGIKATVESHLQESMRPGGSLYRFRGGR